MKRSAGGPDRLGCSARAWVAQSDSAPLYIQTGEIARRPIAGSSSRRQKAMPGEAERSARRGADAQGLSESRARHKWVKSHQAATDLDHWSCREVVLSDDGSATARTSAAQRRMRSSRCPRGAVIRWGARERNGHAVLTVTPTGDFFRTIRTSILLDLYAYRSQAPVAVRSQCLGRLGEPMPTAATASSRA